jgi:hypothetical protein
MDAQDLKAAVEIGYIDFYFSVQSSWSAHCWVQCYTMKVEKECGQTGEGYERRVRKGEKE